MGVPVWPREVHLQVDDAAERRALDRDLTLFGIAFGERVTLPDRDDPVIVRLDPEHVEWKPDEGHFCYNSTRGPILMKPGSGRWVMATRKPPSQTAVLMSPSDLEKVREVLRIPIPEGDLTLEEHLRTLPNRAARRGMRARCRVAVRQIRKRHPR